MKHALIASLGLPLFLLSAKLRPDCQEKRHVVVMPTEFVGSAHAETPDAGEIPLLLKAEGGGK